MEQEKIITPTVERILKNKQKRFAGQFIKGPIPLLWMCKVCDLSKNAIKTALAVRFFSGIIGDGWIELKNCDSAKFMLNRSGKSIGLKELELSGLVKIKRRPGKSPLIKILEIQRIE